MSNIDLSKEEILKLLDDNGINIKMLAAEAKEVKATGGTLKKKVVTKKHETTWDLVMNDHNDFAIKRSNGVNWKMLVVMTSQGIGYFKTKDGTTALERNQLIGFLRGLKRLDIPNTWIGFIAEGASEADALLTVLSCPQIMEGFKYGCGPKYDRYGTSNDLNENRYSYNRSDYGVWLKAYKKHPKLMRDFKDSPKALNLILSSPDFIKEIVDKWDTKNARDFLESYELSLADISSSRYGRQSLDDNYRKRNCIPDCNMEYNAFKEYVLYDSYRMGLARSLASFFDTWRDTIDMEGKLYGKIREKYPKNLQTYHDNLSYKYNIYKEEVNAENFRLAAEKMKFLQAKMNDYIFITPSCPQDMLDEADMQANCLASYVSRVSDGESMIVFMRKASTPEQSFVTIEVREKDGKYGITQQYLAHNNRLDDKLKDITQKWIDNVNKKAAA